MNSEFGRVQAIIKSLLEKIKVQSIAKTLLSSKGRPLIFGAGALVLVSFVILLWPPQRSTAAYCKMWNEGAKTLRGRDSVSHASDYAAFYGRLERVSPEDIRSDVRVLKLVYQKMAKDPTQALAASLSGISASSAVSEWGGSHCSSTTVLNQ